MQSTSEGGMIYVRKSQEFLKTIVDKDISFAVVNSRESCVLSGNMSLITSLERALNDLGISNVRLKTSHAFHSSMMNPILDTFGTFLDDIEFGKAQIPYVSNVTGCLIKNDSDVNSDYWVNHLRSTVNLKKSFESLKSKDELVFVEVGPRSSMINLVKENLSEIEDSNFYSLINSSNNINNAESVLKFIGACWCDGHKINWKLIRTKNGEYSRVALPNHPFKRDPKPLVSPDGVEENLVIPSFQNGVPTSSKEKKLFEIISIAIGNENTGIDDDFFELGIDSLRAVTIVGIMKKEFDVELSDFFEYPTIRRLGHQISFRKISLKEQILSLKQNISEETNTESDNNFYDSNEYKEYAKSSKYVDIDFDSINHYSDILLTGGTGFLGSYLIREILQNTESNLHLIIRGESIQKAHRRIKETLEYYFEEDFYEANKSKLFIYNGDLGKTNFNLNKIDYDNLTNLVDCIFHSAGNPNHYGKYEDFYVGNVECTKRVIDFAIDNGKSKLFHISTLAIFENTEPDGKKKFIDENDIDLNQECTSHYAKTKFEAEKLVIKSREKGVNANIYRVGYILFDSKTGKFQNNVDQNAVYSILKSFENIGCVPMMDKTFDFSFVDCVAESIFKLSQRKELQNEIYHIFNPNFVSLSELLSNKKFLSPVKVVRFDEFLDTILERIDEYDFYDTLSLLRTHLDVNLDETNESVNHLDILCDQTTHLLEKMAFTWPSLTDKHVELMYLYCKEVGYM